MPRTCVVCHKNPPELPDRTRMGRPIRRVCRECHGKRLLGDLREIMAEHDRRLAAAQPEGE